MADMTGKELIEFAITKSEKIRVAKVARDNATSAWAKQYWQSIINAHKRELNAVINLLPDAAVD
jgi:hypothetical protein